MLVTEIPGPALTDIPSAKLNPVRVMVVDVFHKPLAGVMPVKVSPFTVNVRTFETAELVVTVTLRGPGVAPGLTVNVAVIVVEFTTIALLIVIPGIASTDVTPLLKFI